MSQKNKDSSENAPLLSSQDRAAPQMAPPDVAAAYMSQYGTNNANAAVAYMAGYYTDPTAAAAAAAMYGQAPAPPGYYYSGYPAPPPQGYPPVPQQSPNQGMYATQAYMYPNTSYSSSPSQRPPRSVASAVRPVYTDAMISMPNAPAFTTGSDDERLYETSSKSEMKDIFSDDQPLLHPFASTASNGSGYGSTTNKSSTTPSVHPPKIYNAPPRTKTSSGRTKARPTLVRNNSIGELQQLPLNGSTSTSHRRTSSDVPLRGIRPRLNSGDELPPMGHRRVLSSINSSGRGRTLSAGLVKKPTHRRGESNSSILSNVSLNTVVSNIAKSEFYGGVDEKGRVQMHFPFEAIQLVMVDPEQPSLRPGHIYLDGRIDDFDLFEEYHRVAQVVGVDPLANHQWEFLDRSSDEKKLPRPDYILAVNDNIYKRVIGEISDAQTMPCGLFFCGHHEDVAHPSINIAAFLLVLLFGGLAYAAYYTGEITI